MTTALTEGRLGVSRETRGNMRQKQQLSPVCKTNAIMSIHSATQQVITQYLQECAPGTRASFF